jgi:hypothetical protein
MGEGIYFTQHRPKCCCCRRIQECCCHQSRPMCHCPGGSPLRPPPPQGATNYGVRPEYYGLNHRQFSPQKSRQFSPRRPSAHRSRERSKERSPCRPRSQERRRVMNEKAEQERAHTPLPSAHRHGKRVIIVRHSRPRRVQRHDNHIPGEERHRERGRAYHRSRSRSAEPRRDRNCEMHKSRASDYIIYSRLAPHHTRSTSPHRDRDRSGERVRSRSHWG